MMAAFLFTLGGREIRILDILDILIAAYLIYLIYKYIKGTVAVNIFIGIVIFFLLLTIVTELKMRLVALMLGSVAGIGLIGILVIFQPEIRRFLLMIGNNTMQGRFTFLEKYFGIAGFADNNKDTDLTAIIEAAIKNLSQSMTGALIVLTHNDIPSLINTGHVLDAKLNTLLLENLFFKNSPLHDGAVIIRKDRILAASCILPVSSSNNLPAELGLRHRAALGAVEGTDLLAIVVSEENGEVSYAYNGKIYQNVGFDEVNAKMTKFFSEK